MNLPSNEKCYFLIFFWLTFFSVPFVFLGGLILGIFINFNFGINGWDIAIDLSTIIILFLTLVSVFVYTYIAKIQKDQLIRQISLSILPCLQLLFEQDQTDSSRTIKSIQNIGTGVALNVSTEILYDEVEMTGTFEFSRIIPDEKITLTRSLGKGLSEKDFLQKEMLSFSKTTQAKFHFYDIEGHCYEQVYKFENGKHHHGYAVAQKE